MERGYRMNISGNNNLTFKSGDPIEKIASLDNSNIDKASKVLAYQDYKKRSDTTRALAIGVMAGIPAVESLRNAALQTGNMSTRTKAGLITLGAYGILYTAAGALFSLVNKGVSHSEKAHNFAEKNPSAFLLTELAGSVGLVLGALHGAGYLADKLLPKTKGLSEKINSYAITEKTKEIYENLKDGTRNLINKLNGGRIESALNSVGKFMEKGKVVKALGLLELVAITGVFVKYAADSVKLGKDTKNNYAQLDNLRSHAKEIATINKEANTTKELAMLEMEDIR